jgi:N-dimethylarginine dimethylaminohydrolase
MAALPLPHADRMLVCREVLVGEAWDKLVRRFGEARLLPVTEAEIREYATNGLPVGDTLLAPSLVPDRVARLVESLGMRVVRLTMRELCDKAGGASRCLVSRATVDEARLRFPEEYRLAEIAARIREERSS